MYLDVKELRDFYRRPAGLIAKRFLGNKIRECFWPTKGLSLLGLGYAIPYLEMFQGEAASVAAFMPAGQGVLTWPAEGPYLSTLVEETCFPVADASADRILIIHNLELSESVRLMLREVWRVLAPEGKILIAVPNRRGFWARFDSTPFGHGRPYSRGQLDRLLRDCMFEPTAYSSTLYVPPINLGFFLKSAGAWEKLGSKFWPVFSGVLLVEAQKSVYSTIGVNEAVPASSRLSTARTGLPRNSTFLNDKPDGQDIRPAA